MTKANMTADQTSNPKLARAVIRQTGRENLEDIARHGANAGYSGFTYYSDTVPFFKRNRMAIRALAEQQAEDFGQTPMEMIAGFNCLKNPCDKNELLASIARCLYGGRLTDDDTTVANALAWYAAEEMARELNPEI